ncbi:putative sugar phosphate/phosphate translocator, partial [Capsicum baccatum]
IMKVEEGMTLDIYISSVIPIGAMFAMTLWLGNTAYLYISVSFAQMLKAIMPVAVFILGVVAGLEMMSCRMLLIMSVISFGVLVASYGEISINWVGVIYQMGGVVGEALRLIFMEILKVIFTSGTCLWTRHSLVVSAAFEFETSELKKEELL